METKEKNQTYSGSKWYRLPGHNLNTAITDHLFRTHKPGTTHSLGEKRDPLSLSIGFSKRLSLLSELTPS